MVALVPSKRHINRLAADGGEDPNELHMTLKYLGKAADYSPGDRRDVIDSVKRAIKGMGPVKALGFAVSMFNPKAEEACIVLGCGGAELHGVHEAISSEVDGGPEEHKPWIPHVTLKYTGNPDEVGDHVGKTGPITFDKVRVAFGGKNTDIPLDGDASWSEDDEEGLKEDFNAFIEYKDTLTDLEEKKLRHVRTEAGVHRFHAPIGSPIVGHGGSDHALTSFKVIESDYHGFDKVEDHHGGQYYVGKWPGERGVWVTDAKDDNNVIAHAADEAGALTALDAAIKKGGGTALHHVKPKPAGPSAREKLRNAEVMHGSDRSKWTPKQRADAAKLEAQAATEHGGESPKEEYDRLTALPLSQQTRAIQARIRTLGNLRENTGVGRDEQAKYPHIKPVASEYDDYEKFKGADGKDYYLHKTGRKWEAVDANDHSIMSGSRDDVLSSLNYYASKNASATSARGSASSNTGDGLDKMTLAQLREVARQELSTGTKIGTRAGLISVIRKQRENRAKAPTAASSEPKDTVRLKPHQLRPGMRVQVRKYKDGQDMGVEWDRIGMLSNQRAQHRVGMAHFSAGMYTVYNSRGEHITSLSPNSSMVADASSGEIPSARPRLMSLGAFGSERVLVPSTHAIEEYGLPEPQVLEHAGNSIDPNDPNYGRPAIAREIQARLDRETRPGVRDQLQKELDNYNRMSAVPSASVPKTEREHQAAFEATSRPLGVSRAQAASSGLEHGVSKERVDEGEQEVLDAVKRLVGNDPSSEYASIADVRDELAIRGFTTEEQDAVFERMALASYKKASLIPQANTKAVSARDRQNAFVFRKVRESVAAGNKEPYDEITAIKLRGADENKPLEPVESPEDVASRLINSEYHNIIRNNEGPNDTSDALRAISSEVGARVISHDEAVQRLNNLRSSTTDKYEKQSIGALINVVRKTKPQEPSVHQSQVNKIDARVHSDVLKPVSSKFPGWDRFRGSDNKYYDLGKADDDGRWYATGRGGWDEIVASGDSRDEALAALNAHLMGKGDSSIARGDGPDVTTAARNLQAKIKKSQSRKPTVLPSVPPVSDALRARAAQSPTMRSMLNRPASSEIRWVDRAGRPVPNPSQVDIVRGNVRQAKTVEHALQIAYKVSGASAAGEAGGSALSSTFNSAHPRGGKGSAAGGKFVKKGSGSPKKAVKSTGKNNSSIKSGLKRGANGPDVKNLQHALNAALGANLAEDSSFGPLTEAAVRGAQKGLGLPVTGVADQRLLDALNGKVASKPAVKAAKKAVKRSAKKATKKSTSRRRTASTQTTSQTSTVGGREVESQGQATKHKSIVDRAFFICNKAAVITPGGRVGDDSSHNFSPRQNWVDKVGGLPKYIREIRNALVRSGHSESEATSLAIGAVKRWARGGGNVSAKVRAAAAAAVAEWGAKRASAHAH